jgi:thioredoxin reductase (NADPH)
MRHVDLLILGSGPAGHTAAVYAARANLAPVMITGMAPGGQLTTTTDVDNWPADDQGVQGPDLMDRFTRHSARFGTEIIFDHIHTATLGEHPFILVGDAGSYSCKALIVATGASARYLGLPSEALYMGRGVSACATCDGFFFRDQPIAIVGGGNTALEEALYLSNIASHVTMIHRRDSFRGEKILQDKVRARVAAGRISILWSSQVEEIVGDERGVNAVRLVSTIDGCRTDLAVSGVFIAIGHKPNTDVFSGQLEMENGYIVTRGGRTHQQTETSVTGVFAAGDVQDHIYRQAVTSAASGCQAALDAERFLDSLSSVK